MRGLRKDETGDVGVCFTQSSRVIDSFHVEEKFERERRTLRMEKRGCEEMKERTKMGSWETELSEQWGVWTGILRSKARQRVAAQQYGISVE
ncbi:hypothetical protein E2C01_065833 [Portunus trituberculatus]|uniref:Uncharacterized protein n=1 Tax=Portunus trituberculatus TaxID=210409 RepID=A0A5B7HPH2_PORTR|nr:hypothetical protein [Portunus trituberculatus]